MGSADTWLVAVAIHKYSSDNDARASEQIVVSRHGKTCEQSMCVISQEPITHNIFRWPSLYGSEVSLSKRSCLFIRDMLRTLSSLR
jgi:hypothetical protein